MMMSNHNNYNEYNSNNNNNTGSSVGPRAKCDQVVFEAFAKAAEIIVNSRCEGQQHAAAQQQHSAMSNNNNNSSRFNLLVPENANVRMMLQRWRRALHVPLRIDVYYQHDHDNNGSEGQKELLERWCLEYASGNHHLECKTSDPIVQLRYVCKKIVIWLRTLYCHSRLLPAQSLSKNSQPQQQSQPGVMEQRIGFDIYFCNQNSTGQQSMEDNQLLIQNQGFQVLTQPATVYTPYGQLRWEVLHAPKGTIQRLLPPSKQKFPLTLVSTTPSMSRPIPTNNNNNNGNNNNHYYYNDKVARSPSQQPQQWQNHQQQFQQQQQQNHQQQHQIMTDIPQSAPATQSPYLQQQYQQQRQQQQHHHQQQQHQQLQYPQFQQQQQPQETNQGQKRNQLLMPQNNTYHPGMQMETRIAAARNVQQPQQNDPKQRFMYHRSNSDNVATSMTADVSSTRRPSLTMPPQPRQQQPERVLSGLSLALMNDSNNNDDNGNNNNNSDNGGAAPAPPPTEATNLPTANNNNNNSAAALLSTTTSSTGTAKTVKTEPSSAEKRRAALHFHPPPTTTTTTSSSTNTTNNKNNNSHQYGYAYNSQIPWQQQRNNNKSRSPCSTPPPPGALSSTPPSGALFVTPGTTPPKLFLPGIMASGAGSSLTATISPGNLIPPRNQVVKPPFPSRPLGFVYDKQKQQQQEEEQRQRQQQQEQEQQQLLDNINSKLNVPPITSLDLLHSSPFQQPLGGGLSSATTRTRATENASDGVGAGSAGVPTTTTMSLLSTLSVPGVVAGVATHPPDLSLMMGTSIGNSNNNNNNNSNNGLYGYNSSSIIPPSVSLFSQSNQQQQQQQQQQDTGNNNDDDYYYNSMPFAVEDDDDMMNMEFGNNNGNESEHHLQSSAIVASFAQKCTPNHPEHRLKLFSRSVLEIGNNTREMNEGGEQGNSKLDTSVSISNLADQLEELHAFGASLHISNLNNNNVSTAPTATTSAIATTASSSTTSATSTATPIAIKT